MFTVSRSMARLLVIVPFAALLVAACEHNLGLGLTPPGPLATITVTPNPQTLAIGAIQPFVATGRDAASNLVSITPTWTVVALGGAINSSGLFTAGTVAGTFNSTVRATSGSIFGSATVTVTAPGGLATITVTPNPGNAVVLGTIQYTATGRDVANVVVPISPAPTWTVVAGGGTIPLGPGASAVFTAGATPGTYSNTIRATSGSLSGFATAIVTAFVPPVSLGAAAPNGIMAGLDVSCITAGIINADVSISPGNTITPGACTITGVQHLADATALSAQNALTTAYNMLMGLPCPAANDVGTVNIGATTKTAGVYCSASSMQVSGTLTLDGGGDPNATFVFQAGSTLSNAPPPGNIVLIGSAQAKNVWWGVGSSATIGVGSAWQGNILALTTITLNDNATLCGRALARNGSVTLGNSNNIKLPPVAAATCTFP